MGGGGFQSDFFHNVMQQHIFFIKKLEINWNPTSFIVMVSTNCKGKQRKNSETYLEEDAETRKKEAWVLECVCEVEE